MSPPRLRKLVFYANILVQTRKRKKKGTDKDYKKRSQPQIKGNYYYTIGEAIEDDDESDQDEFDDQEFDEGVEESDDQISLDEIPIGEVDAINIQKVWMIDLMDPDKVKTRTMAEQVIINAESLTRVLPGLWKRAAVRQTPMRLRRSR